MARLPRFNLPGIPQHVIQRGNNRQDCFFRDEDYAVYLSKLNEYANKYKVKVHSFVLMTNHVHLLLTPREGDGVSKVMQSLGRYYVRYINQEQDRSGTLWEGRFKSMVVDSERYFLTVSRYIELNPVRAGMVKRPEDYRWSSYHGNALGKSIGLLDAHRCYKVLGATERERQKAYKALFKEPMEAHTVQLISDALNKGWVLGKPSFKKRVEKKSGRRVEPLGRGGDRKSEDYHNGKNQ